MAKKYAGVKVLSEKLVAKCVKAGKPITNKQAEERIKEDIDLINEVLASKEFDGLQFIEFLTLEKIERAARLGRNPRTKEVINIPAKISVKVKLSKAYGEKLNK